MQSNLFCVNHSNLPDKRPDVDEKIKILDMEVLELKFECMFKGHFRTHHINSGGC